MSPRLEPVTLSINGKQYKIACSPDERESLLNSAQLLNEQMRKIQETGKVNGEDRIAVLAALNLAHDLSQSTPADTDLNPAELSDRLLNLRIKIENVLENS